MKYICKRALPDSKKNEMRAYHIKKVNEFCKNLSDNFDLFNEPNGFESGNKKTGTTGLFFYKIYVWNLPYVITCPGASEWCLKNCYNADSREDVFPLERWNENLWWLKNHPAKLKDTLNKQLKYTNEKIGVRIHSSGDFFSIEYIDFWIDIIKSNPTTQFWGYTRSWRVPELSQKIFELSSLKNINLFASWDNSMRENQDIMQKCIVVESLDEIKLLQKSKEYHICGEQFSLVKCCADCGFCANKNKKNIVFIIH